MMKLKNEEGLMAIVLANGFIPIIPVLIWNALLTKRLPKEFGSEYFDEGIPKLILMLETVLRVFVFFIPLTTSLNIKNTSGQSGLMMFVIGIICYFLSWIMLIKYPGTRWCKSIFGFTAPAFTPLIWLFGLSLMIDSYYFKLSYAPRQYMVLSCVFIGVHLTHAVLVFRKTGRFTD